MELIKSFTVDHTRLHPGMYVSRTDSNNTVTYDIRTRRPNVHPVMDTGTVHTVEHIFATVIRNGPLSENIIYFGPMGCRTGFYLITRGISHTEALTLTKNAFAAVAAWQDDIPGSLPEQCGNYRDQNLTGAKREALRMCGVLEEFGTDSMLYPV